MGLLTAPFKGLLRVFEEVYEQADAQMNDDTALKAQLIELHRQLEAGAIDEETFNQREEEIVEELEAIEERKRARGRA